MANNDDNTMETFYHHTDRDSALKIIQSDKILKSEKKNGDAVGGDGTYLTKLGPSHSPKTIAKNNYDGTTGQFYEEKIIHGKTDVAIEFKLPKAATHDHSAELNRDVHRYNDDIDLSKVTDLKFHIRSDEGVTTLEAPKY